MIQTQQFLQQELKQKKSFQVKQQHQSLKKQEFIKCYHELSEIYMSQEEERINQDMNSQEQICRLTKEKFKMRNSVLECSQVLTMTEAEKKEFMGICERKEARLKEERKREEDLKNQIVESERQRDILLRKIKQIQVINSKLNLEKDHLRKRCEQEFENVEYFKLNSQTSSLQTSLTSVIDNNLERLETLSNQNDILQRGTQKDREDERVNSYKTIESLIIQLKRQQQTNFEMKLKLQNQKRLSMFYMAKLMIFEKEKKIHRQISSRQQESQELVEKDLQTLLINNHFLHQKLQKLKMLQTEFSQARSTLVDTMKKIKEQQRKSIRTLGLKSNRLEKSIDGHYMLKQRRNFVDKYKKYLLTQRD